MKTNYLWLFFLILNFHFTGLKSQVVQPSVDLTMPINNYGYDAWQYYYKPVSQLQMDIGGKLISIEYATNGSSQFFSLWNGPTVYPGQLMRFKILIPAGTKKIIAQGESNDWICTPPYCAIMNGFADNPGEFCNLSTGNGTTCGSSSGTYFYQENLTIYAGGYNQIIANTVTPTAKYAYFYLYNGNTTPFRMITFRVNLLISDTNAYTCWRSQRPWAGGPSTNSADGIGEACTTGMYNILSDNDIQIVQDNINESLWVLLNTKETNYTLTIYSLDGKVITRKTENTNEFYLNTQMLERGMYFIEVKNETSKIVKKIVKS